MLNPLEEYFWNKEHKRPLNRWAHYLPVFHRHFGKFRGSPVRLLEIGTSGGGGLYMWRDYFGESATIVGVDIEEASRQSVLGDFKVYIGDQADPAFLRDVYRQEGPFDIVIDDGGHKVSQQVASFETLYPLVTGNGVYLVEDTHTNFWDDFKDCGSTTFIDFAAAKTNLLMDWSKQRQYFGSRFSEPIEQRGGTLEASEFCRTTDSICFYDSVVVFEKAMRPEPYMVNR